jgi:hypothetical protein
MNKLFQSAALPFEERATYITSEGEIEKMQSFECYPNVQYCIGGPVQ